MISYNCNYYFKDSQGYNFDEVLGCNVGLGVMSRRDLRFSICNDSKEGLVGQNF